MNDALIQRHPVFENISLGIGTWAWGDSLFWNYGRGYGEEDLRQVFQKSLAAGVRFFDTAEVYGQGKSETFLGRFIEESSAKVIVATKFMPFPWRLRRKSLIKALKKSLSRLGLPMVDLYQIHNNLPPVTVETWMEAMLEAVQAGLVGAVGVSNYDRQQTQRALDTLTSQGVPLASNQVEYHLLNRTIEKNGLLDQCREQGVTIIAYSPLAQGILSGKYSPEHLPGGVRRGRYGRRYLDQIQPLLRVMRKIGADREGKTPAQVALNWTICKGTLPIPGAKTPGQLEQNLGALDWKLTEEEIAQLDETSDQVIRNL